MKKLLATLTTIIILSSPAVAGPAESCNAVANVYSDFYLKNAEGETTLIEFFERIDRELPGDDDRIKQVRRTYKSNATKISSEWPKHESREERITTATSMHRSIYDNCIDAEREKASKESLMRYAVYRGVIRGLLR